jgi:dGTP triphosphohydrolase
MFPNNFDEWLSVNKVVNKNKSFEEQLKECWNSARDNLLKENKDLETKLEEAEDAITYNSCPYDYCQISDYEDIENDLDRAKTSLEKCQKARRELNDILDRMQECETFSDFKDDILKDLEVVMAKFDDVDIEY